VRKAGLIPSEQASTLERYKLLYAIVNSIATQSPIPAQPLSLLPGQDKNSKSRPFPFYSSYGQVANHWG
jgi:hypothetical protein